MTSADAFKVLGCEAGVSREAITRQYQAQYTEAAGPSGQRANAPAQALISGQAP
jgi:hypothetical protein